jgi:hypothetical protein
MDHLVLDDVGQLPEGVSMTSGSRKWSKSSRNTSSPRFWYSTVPRGRSAGSALAAVPPQPGEVEAASSGKPAIFRMNTRGNPSRYTSIALRPQRPALRIWDSGIPSTSACRAPPPPGGVGLFG